MKLIFKLLLLLAAVPSIAYSQGMIGQISSTGPNSTTGATRYLGISAGGNVAWNATESTMFQIMPVTGTFSALRATLSGTSGTGSRAFTVRKNGADSALTTTITNATSNSDLSNSVSVSAGDTVDLKQVTSGTLNAVTTYWNLIFTAANANEYPLLHNPTGTMPAAGAVRYISLQGDAGYSTTEATRTSVIPTSGTLSKMYILLNSTLTGTFIVTVRVNGVDTALTTTVTAGNTTANNTSNTISVSPGDRVTVSVTNNDGSVLPRMAMGLKWSPTVNGEVIATYPMAGSQAASTTRYYPVMGASIGPTGTEGSAQQICSAATIKKLYIYNPTPFFTDGEDGDTIVNTFRLNGSDSSITTTLNATEGAANDTAHTVTCSNGDLISMGSTASAGTGTVQVSAGLVMLVDQPGTPTPTPTSTPTIDYSNLVRATRAPVATTAARPTIGARPTR